MLYKAIIFDLDGVICHTDKYHYTAWKQLADKLHIPFDKKVNDRLRGVSRMQSLEIILEGKECRLSEEEKIRLAAEKNEIYRHMLSNMTPADLDSDVKRTLDILRYKGILLAIGSSSKNARFILENIGLSGYFNTVSDGNNITSSKPDPQVFIIAADNLNLQPKDCLVVEDAMAGVEAAHAGGMDCAAIGSATENGTADYNLFALRDLLPIFGL